MKAIKIDVVTKSVYEIEINSWRDIAPAIGNECQLFECPVVLPNNDAVYVDEEGWLKEPDGGFYFNFIPPLPIAFAGSAVIQGTNSEGESIAPQSKIEDIEAAVSWVSADQIHEFSPF
jgi:hypothetical protein